MKGARFGDQRTDKGALRHNANVLGASSVEADYDAGKVAFHDAVACLRDAGITGILYTSSSYCAAVPKWRVVVPFSTELRPEERSRMMDRLAGVFANIGVEFAPESWVLAQGFHYGHLDGSTTHQVEHVIGTMIDLRDDLDGGAIGKPGKRTNGSEGRPSGPMSRPEDITDERIRGLSTSLLDHLRHAKDGEKHPELVRIGRTLGGYLHLIGWSKTEAVDQLLDALPPSVKDWNKARHTAQDAVNMGLAAPLELEDRPNPNARKGTGNGQANPVQPAAKDHPRTNPKMPPRQSDPDIPARFTENALAGLFTDAHAEDLIYVHEWGSWRVWDEGRWREDHAVSVFDRARKIHLARDEDLGRRRMVREFITEFRGLSGSSKQKTVLEETGTARLSLAEFASSGTDIDHEAAGKLLASMQRHTRPPHARDLGVIGRDHLLARFGACGVRGETFQYKAVIGDADNGVPAVIETAFGWRPDAYARRIVTGVNFSVALGNPFRSFGQTGQGLEHLLAQQRAGRNEPIVFFLHLASPRVEFSDRGKTALVIGEGKPEINARRLSDDLFEAIIDEIAKS